MILLLSINKGFPEHADMAYCFSDSDSFSSVTLKCFFPSAPQSYGFILMQFLRTRGQSLQHVVRTWGSTVPLSDAGQLC